MSNLIPVGMTWDQLADLLNHMASLIRSVDSFEGNIEYLLPDEQQRTQTTADVMVRGTFRVGNTNGQGGVRIIGTIPSI